MTAIATALVTISDPFTETIAKARDGKGSPPPADTQMRLEWIETVRLVVDARYQRRISDRSLARMRKIAQEFTWARFGALIVARSGDVFAVMDGQHRAMVALSLGIDRVPAAIVEADVATQARDFVGINTTRTAVASIDKFRARVTSGDPVAMEVEEILRELGIIADVPAGVGLGPQETRAVSLLEKLVTRIGKGLTFTTLEIMLDAQPGQANLLTAFAIEATALVVAKLVDAEADLDRLESILADLDFDSVKSEAAQLVKLTGGKTAYRGAELILRAYNKRLQKKVQ